MNTFLHKPAVMKTLLLLPVFFIVYYGKAQTIKCSVYFAHDNHTLDEANRQRLDSLATSWQKQSAPPLLIITGNCDSTGSDAYNMALSEKRIQTVKEYLLGRLGVSPVIYTSPKGESEPMADNSAETGRSLNRRVDINYEVPVQEAVKAEPDPPGKKEDLPLNESVKRSSAGDKIVLKNLLFQGAMHRLLPTSEPVLQELLTIMKDNPTLEIDIQGHICCVTGPEDAQDWETRTNDLSLQRAKVVYEYLLRNGIPSARMTYRGFGHQFPITMERTGEEQQTNRRVEIKIVKK